MRRILIAAAFVAVTPACTEVIEEPIIVSVEAAPEPDPCCTEEIADVSTFVPADCDTIEDEVARADCEGQGESEQEATLRELRPAGVPTRS